MNIKYEIIFSLSNFHLRASKKQASQVDILVSELEFH